MFYRNPIFDNYFYSWKIWHKRSSYSNVYDLKLKYNFKIIIQTNIEKDQILQTMYNLYIVDLVTLEIQTEFFGKIIFGEALF